MPERYDAIVIGSGFGGAMAAHELVNGGLRVLMLERGSWVQRGAHNWEPGGSLELTPAYDTESAYEAPGSGHKPQLGIYACVGGPSVFYGGVSFRLREADFEPDDELLADSGARWPFGYADLEPYYGRAESLLGVAGDDRGDPTAPRRSAPYPQPPAPLGPTSSLIGGAAEALGLRPFRLPLAINYAEGEGRHACIGCTTCDTFACAISAKNDIATGLLPRLIAAGMELRPETVVVKLHRLGARLTEVECIDKRTNSTMRYSADRIVLAAGALSTPLLLMASGLPGANPAGDAVGRYLVRHVNGMTFAVFPRLPDRGASFQKQLAITDYYFGPGDDAAADEPRGRLGTLQSVQGPPAALVRANTPWPVGWIVTPLMSRITGLLAMAEDQPRADNRLQIDRERRDRFGLPRLTVMHRYTERDEAARNALLRRARRILRQAGGRVFYDHRIRTFSHASGTVRAGLDPKTSPLDPWCRFRGIDNLFVTDASFMPTSGAVNPSLTIAANALRVGAAIASGTVPTAQE